MKKRNLSKQKNVVQKALLTNLNFEIHIVEHCNLNCKSCAHFSPLAYESYLDLKIFEKDLKRLADLGKKNVKAIRLMGGEPLLHPQLIDFFDIARIYFPLSDIYLITNGILLLKQPKEFWIKCSQNNIIIEISYYPIILDSTALLKKAQKHSLQIIYSINTGQRYFWNMKLDIYGKQNMNESFTSCWQANDVINLKNGKLYTCATIPNIDHFNNYFDKNLFVTEKDFINIYTVEHMNDVFDFLSKPVPFCKYCKNESLAYSEWGGSEKCLKEWI